MTSQSKSSIGNNELTKLALSLLLKVPSFNPFAAKFEIVVCNCFWIKYFNETNNRNNEMNTQSGKTETLIYRLNIFVK